MQLHIHVGLDTRVGKTLSAILSLRALAGSRVLILDFDPFSAKLYSLLEPLREASFPVDNTTGNHIFKLSQTNVYVGFHTEAMDLDQFHKKIAVAIQAAEQHVRTLQPHFSFEHVIIDTSHTFLNYKGIAEPLTLPTGLTRMKFWVNYGYITYIQSTTASDFWSSYNKIRLYHSDVAFHKGTQRDPLIHIFGPQSFMAFEDSSDNVLEILRKTFQLPTYHKLVNTVPDDQNWIGPEWLYYTAAGPRSFDRYLAALTNTTGLALPGTVGRKVAEYWLVSNEYPVPKPINVAFIPFDDDLINYRDIWPKYPPRTLASLWKKMERVTECSALRNQWSRLTIQ